MPMHTADTRLSHLDCLQKLGWLSFDVTHMGEPDGYLLSPCCEHGYRAVWSPRPKMEWTRAFTQIGGQVVRQGFNDFTPGAQYLEPGLGGSGSVLESVWNWSDAYGGDQANFFNVEQAMGREGSWVLVAGARQDGDGPPIDAEAKWWTTTQNDADSLEEELSWWGGPHLGYAAFGGGVNPASHLYGGQGPGDYGSWGHHLGLKHHELSNIYDTVTHPAHQGLRRWVKNEDPVTGSESGLGIEDPGLGQASGLPNLDAGFATDTIWWIKYGNRSFLGVNKCNDPLGANQERDDHDIHGSGSNWRGIGLPDINVNDIISAQASARGGYTPHIVFYGGDVRGAKGTAIVDDSGNITGINITDPGATVITDAQQDSIEAPLTAVSMPNHYTGFDAKAKISTNPAEIKSVLPDLFKSKYELLSECSGGYNDPIAQTFMVSARRYPDGIFVPSIDICFASRPRFGIYDPVYLELRPTLNGFPSADKIIASKVLYPHSVNVSPGVDYDEMPFPPWENPIHHSLGGSRERRADYPAFDNAFGYTRFVFRYPIYLEAGQEYAIIVRSNNTDYK